MKLSASTLKEFRKDLEGRDKDTPGYPYWTERLAMVLSHAEELERENTRLKSEMARLSLREGA